MSQARINLTKIADMKHPNQYVLALQGEYSNFAFEESKAPQFKGVWRQEIFKTNNDAPLDLEIGTGNGYFYAHRAATYPQRNLVGLEIKFKPLIQSIRRALNVGAQNMRICRYHGGFVTDLFEPGELNDVFIHHPDPWTKRRRHKHRLMKAEFLRTLYDLQRSGSYLEFKTDSQDYFMWAKEQFAQSPYIIDRYTENLHQSEWSSENFVTHFEKIFISQGLPIYYLRAQKLN